MESFRRKFVSQRGNLPGTRKDVTIPIPDDNDVGQVPIILYSIVPKSALDFSDRRGSYCDVLWFYLNFGYIFGLVPFRLGKDSQAQYRLAGYKVQKVLCAFMHLFLLTYCISKWHYMNVFASINSSAGTDDYFVLVFAFTETAYMLSFMRLLWQSQEAFVWIARNYPDRTKEPKRESRSLEIRQALIRFSQRAGLLGLLLCSLSLFISVENFAIEFLEEKQIFGYNGYLYNTTKNYFFIDQKAEINEGLGVVLAIVYVLSCFAYNTMLNYGTLFSALLGLILLDVGSHFEATLNRKDCTTQEAISAYKCAKEFIQKINEVFGLLVLFSVLSSVPYYGNSLPGFLHGEKISLLERAEIGYNLAIIGLFLYLSSTLVEKMGKIQAWLAVEGRSDEVPANELRGISDELALGTVGLSGCGYFIVSYASIGRLMQLLVTYGFIATDHGNTAMSSFSTTTKILDGMELR